MTEQSNTILRDFQIRKTKAQKETFRAWLCAELEKAGYAPKVEAIHAGLECGLFSAKLPGLDCVSFGPDLREIHTFRESMSVASVQRVYAMVVETLKRMH